MLKYNTLLTHTNKEKCTEGHLNITTKYNTQIWTRQMYEKFYTILWLHTACISDNNDHISQKCL